MYIYTYIYIYIYIYICIRDPTLAPKDEQRKADNLHRKKLQLGQSLCVRGCGLLLQAAYTEPVKALLTMFGRVFIQNSVICLSVVLDPLPP